MVKKYDFWVSNIWNRTIFSEFFKIFGVTWVFDLAAPTPGENLWSDLALVSCAFFALFLAYLKTNSIFFLPFDGRLGQPADNWFLLYANFGHFWKSRFWALLLQNLDSVRSKNVQNQQKLTNLGFLDTSRPIWNRFWAFFWRFRKCSILALENLGFWRFSIMFLTSGGSEGPKIG